MSRQLLLNEVWGYSSLLRTERGSYKLIAIGFATGKAGLFTRHPGPPLAAG